MKKRSEAAKAAIEQYARKTRERKAHRDRLQMKRDLQAESGPGGGRANPSTDGRTHLPDGRPIIQPPSVTFAEAAEQLGVTVLRVSKMVDEGELKTLHSGQRVSVPSLRVASRRLARRGVSVKRKLRKPQKFVVAEQLAREDAEEARRLEAMERRHARQPQKGYRQPKEGMRGRPSGGGLPTLGRRG